MPCRCDIPGVYGIPGTTEWDSAQLLDRLTRVSCDMRTIIRRAGLELELTEETRAWIAEHDEADAKRIAEAKEVEFRNNCRLRALDKLTLEERRVLGL